MRSGQPPGRWIGGTCPLGEDGGVGDDAGGESAVGVRAKDSTVSAAISCGAAGEREALDLLTRLDGVDPLVREHALAIVSAMLSGGSRAHDADERRVTLDASVADDALRVELEDGCFDLRPTTLARRHEGIPGPAVALVERLADSWGIAYDGELRVWFAISR